MTIDKAKELLSQTSINNVGIQMRSGDDDVEQGARLTLGWDNASEYYDEESKLAVVEIPILKSNLSKTFQVLTDTSQSNGYENNGQIEKLLITQDTNFVYNITILKISGTINYLAANDINENSFRGIDANFEGLAKYYNLEDSLLKDYVIRDGEIHEVMEVHETTSEERWGLCIAGWLTVKACTGGPDHTCDNRSECECGKEGHLNCDPPICVPILTECGGPPIISNPPGTSLGNPRLPDPPNNPWGSGGGTPNTGNCNCSKKVIDDYWRNYNPSLDVPFGNYWFNINHVVVGPNCKDGTFTSGTYKVYLVPNQTGNGNQIDYSVAMDYCISDYSIELEPCKWKKGMLYSGTITWHVVWTVGPITVESSWVDHFESFPELIFE